MGLNDSPPDRDATPIFAYARLGLWALPVWSILLLVGTWTHQPDPDTDFASYAEYITTTWFLISHLVASILGAAIGLMGMVALFIVLSRSASVRLATLGLVASIVGTVLVTSVFGVAAFAQPAIGNAYLAGETSQAIGFDSDVYGTALFATALPGILVLTIGLVLLGTAVARSGILPREAGYIFAVAGVLFALIGFAIGIVQTIGAVLLTISSIWIAAAYRKRRAEQAGTQQVEVGAPAVH